MIKAINPNKSDYREDWFAKALGFALRRKEKMQFTIATISFPEPSQPLSFLHFVFLRLKKGRDCFVWFFVFMGVFLASIEPVQWLL